MTSNSQGGDQELAAEAVPSAKQSLATNLQILVAIMVPFFGVVNTWQAQYLQTQLQQVKQESERKQQFAGSIQAQLENLTGQNPTKAKVALASLYTLAKEESDKSILFTIAIVSGNDAMRSTIADLVLEDANASPKFKDQIRLKLGKILTAASQDSRSYSTEPIPSKDVSAEKRLLEHLTQDQKKITGWIYIGKTATGGNSLAEDKTIQSSVVPVVGKGASLATSVNLRESAPSGRVLGRINGIVSKGSEVVVDEINRRAINAANDAVWARITVQS